MGVLWTTCEVGPATFRELQRRCETISTAVLNQRIKELQAARLLTRSTEGYVATDLGRQIYEHLAPLGQTARVWAEMLRVEEAAAD